MKKLFLYFFVHTITVTSQESNLNSIENRLRILKRKIDERHYTENQKLRHIQNRLERLSNPPTAQLKEEKLTQKNNSQNALSPR